MMRIEKGLNVKIEKYETEGSFEERAALIKIQRSRNA